MKEIQVRFVNLISGRVESFHDETDSIRALNKAIARDFELYKPIVVVLHPTGRITAVSKRHAIVVEPDDTPLQQKRHRLQTLPQCVIVEVEKYGPIVLP